MISATITKIQLGLLELDGLMFEDGSFGVGVPQIANIFPYFQDSQSQASQKLKRLMGKDFKTHKCKYPGQKRYVLFISLLDFEKVLRKLDKAGDKVAETLSEALIGVSLHQTFSRAFGQQFEEVNFQQWLVQRYTHRNNFHLEYTVWLKNDGITSTYGTEVNRLKLAAKTPLISIEEYTYEQIAQLNRAESAYNALRKAGLSHSKALEIIEL